MPLARIFAHSVEDTDTLSDQLRARGYHVEVVFPDAIPSSRADLELRVERCTAEQAVARVEANSDASDKCVFIAPCTQNRSQLLARKGPNRELLVFEMTMEPTGTEGARISVEPVHDEALTSENAAKILQFIPNPSANMKDTDVDTAPPNFEDGQNVSKSEHPAGNWASDLFPVVHDLQEGQERPASVEINREEVRSYAPVGPFMLAASALLAAILGTIIWVESHNGRTANASSSATPAVSSPASAPVISPGNVVQGQQQLKQVSIPPQPVGAVAGKVRHERKPQGVRRRPLGDEIIAPDTITHYPRPKPSLPNPAKSTSNAAKAISDLPPSN